MQKRAHGFIHRRAITGHCLIVLGPVVMITFCACGGQTQRHARIEDRSAPPPALAAPEPLEKGLREASQFLVAIDHSPRGGAAAARFRAARAAARAAGVLPQPAVEVMAMRAPRMNENGVEITLMQELPRWGERSAARAMATAEIQMATSDAAVTRGEIAAMTATMIAEAMAAERRAGIQREAAGQARILAETITNAVGAGKGGLPEALALRTRTDEAEVMAKDADRDAADMRENARALLGLAADAALPETLMPSLDQVDATGGAMAGVARARQRLADAQRDDAASLGRAGVMLEGRFQRMGEPDADIYSVGVRVGLPVHRSPATAGIDAARARQRAGVLDEQGERLRARQLGSRAQRALVQRQSVHDFAEAATQRVQAELDTFVVKLGTGGADTFTGILDRFDRLREIRLQVVEMDVAADRALADLWMVVDWSRIAGAEADDGRGP